MDSYAERNKVKLCSLVFIFDGDVLNGSESPQTLELEGGECIDVYKVKEN